MIPGNPYFWKFPETDERDESGYSGFTNPFRYIPEHLVVRAGELVIERLTEWSSMHDGTHLREIERSFAEGKMLGVLVCSTGDSSKAHIGFIAGFSGSVKGEDGLATCTVEGFVPPIIDITSPEGYFRKAEAEISGLNKELDSLISSDEFSQLQLELKRAETERDIEIESLQARIRISKAQREETRKVTTDPSILEELIRESQFQKAELKRAKDKWKENITEISAKLTTQNI